MSHSHPFIQRFVYHTLQWAVWGAVSCPRALWCVYWRSKGSNHQSSVWWMTHSTPWATVTLYKCWFVMLTQAFSMKTFSVARIQLFSSAGPEVTSCVLHILWWIFNNTSIDDGVGPHFCLWEFSPIHPEEPLWGQTMMLDKRPLLARTLCSSSSQSCWMGLRSGLFVPQSSCSTPNSPNRAFGDLCLGRVLQGQRRSVPKL